MSMARMRTVPKAHGEIKKIDPETDLTLRGLRRKVADGEIPVVLVGNKRLINLDTLIDNLYTPASPALHVAQAGAIRRVEA